MWASRSLAAHDLFGKPVSAFADHQPAQPVRVGLPLRSAPALQSPSVGREVENRFPAFPGHALISAGLSIDLVCCDVLHRVLQLASAPWISGSSSISLLLPRKDRFRRRRPDLMSPSLLF